MPEFVFNADRHTYHVDGILFPSITQIIPSDFSMVPPAILKRACERGKAVHKACELFNKGTLDYATVTASVEPYLVAWVQYLADFDVEIDKRAVEVPQYHPIARYAGTPDVGDWEFDCYVRGKLALVEIKTVAKMDRKVRRQTGGQFHLINYWRRKAGLDLIEERHAVKLKDNGKYVPELHTDQCDITEFLALNTMLHADVRDGLRRYPSDLEGE